MVEDTVPHLLDTFRPDLVLYDAGVDPHVLDDLGKLSLSISLFLALNFPTWFSTSHGWILVYRTIWVRFNFSLSLTLTLLVSLLSFSLPGVYCREAGCDWPGFVAPRRASRQSLCWPRHSGYNGYRGWLWQGPDNSGSQAYYDHKYLHTSNLYNKMVYSRIL